jgi:hypothetical protein
MRDCPSLGEVWGNTPWGHVGVAALSVMGIAIIAALFSGQSFLDAVTFGLYCGPGFIAFAAVVSVLMWFFGWKGKPWTDV